MSISEMTGGAGLNYDGFWLYRANAASTLRISFTDGSTDRLTGTLAGTGSLVGNNWYNIVVVFDRDVSVQAYINGVKQTTYFLDITPQQGDVANYANMKIGGTTGSSVFIDGLMDEVRIYNAAMPTSQIKEQYYVGLNGLLFSGQINAREYSERINLISRNE